MSRILNYYGRNIFEISDHYIKVVFPFGEYKNISDNNNDNVIENVNEKAVLDTILKEPMATIKFIAAEIGMSSRNVSRIIKKLKEKKIITRIGSDRTGYWKIDD